MPQVNSTVSSVQTYSPSGKISTGEISNSSAPSGAAGTRRFEDLMISKFEEPFKAVDKAEAAVELHHKEQISQEEFTMIMNEAHIQLTEFKATVEKSLTALQEVLRSSFS